MDARRLAEIDALLADLAPWPWRECGHDGETCTCGLIWDASGDGVVAIAQSHRNSEVGEGFKVAAMQRHARFIAAAPGIIAELLAALRESDRAPGDG